VLEAGVEAPDFDLADDSGTRVRLSDQRGRWVVLWWYPEAKSEGCTIQGRGFQKTYEQFAADGVVVLGASFNDADKNRDFSECEAMQFPLLSDPDGTAGRAYDVVRKPDERFADKPRRVTYLIDPEGRIAKSYLVTDVAGHASQVLADRRELAAATGR